MATPATCTWAPARDAYPALIDTMRHKLDVLRRRCDEAGRDYDEIERTSLGTVHLAPGR